MKELKEIQLKGELHDIISREASQAPNETIQQYNGRIIDLTNEIFNLFVKYNV